MKDQQAYDASAAIVYEIRLQGHLGPQWSDWFEGLAVTLEEDGTTLLSGPVADQAALHGLLRKVRDLGVPLLAVRRLGRNAQDTPHGTQAHHSEEE